MAMSQLIVIGIGVLLCAVASLAYRKGWKVRVSVFILALVLFFTTIWIITVFFSFKNILLYIFILPLGPIMLGVIGLINRGGIARPIGIFVAAAILLSCSYAAVAVHASNASYALQGIMHLPTFLKGQQAVRDNLNDPDSAVFKDLRLRSYHEHKYMCGEVNARNRMGGLAGFTRFYVRLDKIMPSTFFDNNSEHNSFNKYMRTCYGDDWDKNM